MNRTRFEVWVDEDLCSGCGKCVQHAPEVFTHVNGLSRVMEAGRVLDSCEIALVPVEQVSAVITAAEDCPGEIISVNVRE